MPTVFMIRHGEAAAGWNADLDPGLSEKGRVQAEAVASAMHARTRSPLAVLSSPLRRCRETASPLTSLWNCQSLIETRVAEIPSTTKDLAERGEWLRRIWACRWNDLPDLGPWRRSVVAALTELRHDAVIFTHYVAINVAVGAALGDDRLICCRPDNASVTVLQTSFTGLSLIEKGKEADTRVN
jgi:broad specificity phosphatase PhoE